MTLNLMTKPIFDANVMDSMRIGGRRTTAHNRSLPVHSTAQAAVIPPIHPRDRYVLRESKTFLSLL